MVYGIHQVGLKADLSTGGTRQVIDYDSDDKSVYSQVCRRAVSRCVPGI